MHHYASMSQTAHVPPLSTVEVCKELGGIDRSTLSRWVKAGRIHPLRQMPGQTGAFLFDAAEVARVKASTEEGWSA